MALAKDYVSVMSHKGEIMEKALGMDLSASESGSTAFDYKKIMSSTGFSMGEVERVQGLTGVGNIPPLTLRNPTALARKCAKLGYSATICVKDEMTNPSGSSKARRAACVMAFAKTHGYKGIVAAISDNYGAVVVSQAAMQGFKCTIIQEACDSREMDQPEITEKVRACEAMGAEAVQITAGPELLYESLSLLEDTDSFNASPYSPFGTTGIETLGHEITLQCYAQPGRDPDTVVCTNVGGGMVTGTVWDLRKARAGYTQIVAASIGLTGLHMASDTQFNRKPCTTDHIGFGVPFANWPDHSDVPRSAARPLRYMNRYVTVTQDEAMCIIELLASLEGLEHDPAGNIPLAVAFCLVQELPEDQVLVASETKCTGAGKHMQPQLDLVRENGTEVRFGKPGEEVPSVSVVLPADPYQFQVRDPDPDKVRHSLIKTALKTYTTTSIGADYELLVQETNKSLDRVKEQAAAIVSVL